MEWVFTNHIVGMEKEQLMTSISRCESDRPIYNPSEQFCMKLRQKEFNDCIIPGNVTRLVELNYGLFWDAAEKFINFMVTGPFPAGLFPSDFSQLGLFLANIFPAKCLFPVGFSSFGIFQYGSFPAGIFIAIFKHEYKLMTTPWRLELVWFLLFWFGWLWLELGWTGLVRLR